LTGSDDFCRHYAGEVLRRARRRGFGINFFNAIKSEHLPQVILLTQGTLAKACRCPLIAADPIGGSAVSQVTRSVTHVTRSSPCIARGAPCVFRPTFRTRRLMSDTPSPTFVFSSDLSRLTFRVRRFTAFSRIAFDVSALRRFRVWHFAFSRFAFDAFAFSNALASATLSRLNAPRFQRSRLKHVAFGASRSTPGDQRVAFHTFRHDAYLIFTTG
jgi:hypothetical protein